MKRSDMIQQMSEVWLGLFPGEDVREYGVDVEDLRHKMSNLLSFLEHRGMKPPVEEVCPVIFTTKYV